MNFEFDIMPIVIVFFVGAAIFGAGIMYVYEHVDVNISITKGAK